MGKQGDIPRLDFWDDWSPLDLAEAKRSAENELLVARRRIHSLEIEIGDINAAIDATVTEDASERDANGWLKSLAKAEPEEDEG